MKKFSLMLITIVSISLSLSAQPKQPKLVVGLVIDQMRWDYLYKYADRYGSGGFKKLVNDGFSCENTFISHLPSYTAVGHATIFTGSIPAVHGIAGNNWIDPRTGKNIYCTDDSTVISIGSNSKAGKMSPKNLLANTIGDELKMATNFRSKVVGVSLKDRASILPAGHSADGAFWFDDESRKFITSSWYLKELPQWVNDFNAQKPADALIAEPWNTMYPINTYKQSTADNVSWEGKYKGEKTTTFPHDLRKPFAEDPEVIRTSPYGNTLTLNFAKAAIEGYQLGKNEVTDFLTINCASTDYVGHQFGPNSIEVEDTYLRLDRDLETFINYLDQKIGKGNYLIFLSADHGAAHAIGYSQAHKMNADFFQGKEISKNLDSVLNRKYGRKNLVLSYTNYQIYLNRPLIESLQLDIEDITKTAIQYLRVQTGVQFIANFDNIGAQSIPEPLKTMLINGHNLKRSGDIQLIPETAWFEGKKGGTGTTHGTWGPFDTHIPLLFYGWNIKPGKTNRTVHMTDIAPTVTSLLNIQMPNGSVGNVITEIAK